MKVCICPRCNYVDDAVPHQSTGESRRCPCPHSPEQEWARALASAKRHREAVARARSGSAA